MKKVVWATTTFLSVLYISCDRGGNEVNEPPSAVTIEVAAEDLGNSINFTWKAATDPNGDKIVYDFYANTQIAGADLTKLGYNWLSSEHTDIKYPISFKVVAKDGKGGTSESNTIERQDPIIGKWQLEQIFVDGVLDETTDNCEIQSTWEFKANGTLVDIYREYPGIGPGPGTNCDEHINTGTWENNQGKYRALYLVETTAEELMITFEVGKLNLAYEAKETDEKVKEVWARVN